MSAVMSGLIGGLIASGLVTLAARTQKSAAKSHGGWRVLRAGWLINGLIICSIALAALMAYFLLSGGSTLPDASSQNGYAVLLFAAFTACAFCMAWTGYGRTIMWKGYDLQTRAVARKAITRRLSDVTNVRKSEMLGTYRITFRDGSGLWFSAYMHGANELLAKLPRRASRD